MKTGPPSFPPPEKEGIHEAEPLSPLRGKEGVTSGKNSVRIPRSLGDRF